jgi:segregation and condensation protein A
MPPASPSAHPGADLPESADGLVPGEEPAEERAAAVDEPATPVAEPAAPVAEPAAPVAGAAAEAPLPSDGAASVGADGLFTGRGGRTEAFVVELDNFTGPFDLLLSLIAKHKMDVTEVALAKVTDEFVAHIRRLGDEFDLGQATEFLVIAATLLDLKAARLLPTAASDSDDEDLALLEARDLLFARLLQYRAYKEAASIFASLIALEGRHTPRAVPLEPRYVAALPEVQITVGPSELAAMAARLREPVLPPTVATDHVHAPKVSVREHMLVVIQRLRELGAATFRQLCVGCTETIEVVARFLALLELFREGRISFEQESPLGELTVRWSEEQPATEVVGGGLDPLTQFPARSDFDDEDERDDEEEGE